ncbi:hypothetical protein [Streptomyces sp. NBC_01314]|nr:hypothetical protein OG622_50275 [Streptomyces sp. NBC_01314]
MPQEPTFQDRMFMEGEAVYAQIERGECTDVEAALMNAHARASQSDNS